MAAAPPASRYAHGRSEYWSRPSTARLIARAQRRLGLRLRGIRQRLLLTQEEAAERAGLHPVAIARIESGKQNATVATLVCLARAYRVPLAGFFADDPERTRRTRG